MKRKIKAVAHEIAFDEEGSRFFLVGTGVVNVFDLKTNEKLAALRGVRYTNHVRVSRKNNLLIVSSTCGEFAFFRLNDLSLIGKVKIRGELNTDMKFIYDEKENIVVGTLDKNGQYLYRISPLTLTYSLIKLDKVKCDPNATRTLTRYNLIGYRSDNYYMIRNCYDLDFDDSNSELTALEKCAEQEIDNLKNLADHDEHELTKAIEDFAHKYITLYGELSEKSEERPSTPRKKRESTFGRYTEEGGKIVLQEVMTSNTERDLEIYDVEEPEEAEGIRALQNTMLYQRNFFRCPSGFYVIADHTLYKKIDGGFKEIYSDETLSFYEECSGRSYIGTWNYCLVQDIFD